MRRLQDFKLPYICIPRFAIYNLFKQLTASYSLYFLHPCTRILFKILNWNLQFPHNQQMDPAAPSQPPLNTAYNHPSNPASQNPSEAKYSTSTSASLQRSDATAETRKPNDLPDSSSHGENDPIPSSLGYGARDDSGDRGDEVSPFYLWQWFSFSLNNGGFL